MIFQGLFPWNVRLSIIYKGGLAMKPLESNTEAYELSSFSRKLEPEDHLKDRLIIRHLRHRKNNFINDFDRPDSRPIKPGVDHE